MDIRVYLIGQGVKPNQGGYEDFKGITRVTTDKLIKLEEKVGDGPVKVFTVFQKTGELMVERVTAKGGVASSEIVALFKEGEYRYFREI